MLHYFQILNKIILERDHRNIKKNTTSTVQIRIFKNIY